MGGRGRSAGAVEVVGDRLAAPALVGPQVEDLGDHRRLVGSGTSRVLVSPACARAGTGCGLRLEPVAVGGPAAAAEALQRVLAHPALGLARELRALVLVEGLLQRDHQPALGGRRVAGADGVVDLDPDLAQLAVEQAGRDPVAREARGLVDHDAVEAPGRRVARLLGQRRPARPVVLCAGLLVEELAHDLAAQLGGLALAGLQLRRARQGLVLLVVGRETAARKLSEVVPPGGRTRALLGARRCEPWGRQAEVDLRRRRHPVGAAARCGVPQRADGADRSLGARGPPVR